MAIRTVGHGTLGAEELTSLLHGAGVDTVADVRRHPGSRRHPHVARDAMARWLPAANIGYRWIGALGGRRSPIPDSRHIGLRNEQFRAYADHMASDEFAEGLAELRQLAASASVAVMCSEALWWRCHRRLLADRLVLVDRTAVEHLFHDGRCSEHLPTPEARPDGGVVVYDAVADPRLDASWGTE